MVNGIVRVRGNNRSNTRKKDSKMNNAKRKAIARRLKALAVDMRQSAEMLKEHGATEKAHEMVGAAEMVDEWAVEVVK